MSAHSPRRTAVSQAKDQIASPRFYATRIVVLFASIASVAAFFYYARAGSLLLYGDAVAHINIARRVFDSRTPGLLQLGTVWLPLPHILLMPFIASDRLWQSGIGGSLPSLAAYILSVVAVFRLTRTMLREAFSENTVTVTAAASAALFALNPNLLYLQSTAMTEAIYLAIFLWTTVFFEDFLSSESSLADLGAGARRSLRNCLFCLAAASLIRYDGWFLAAMIGAILFFLWLREFLATETPRQSGRVRPKIPTLLRLALMISAAPLLWLAYNAAVYRNPLEFANGPYSARSIELHSTATTHPGFHDPLLAARYFLKSVQLNLADAHTAPLLLIIAFIGALYLALTRRRLAAILLLWSPLPFYALSIAYGSVPLYVPDWTPFGLYNVRYGVQLLPAISVFVPIAVAYLTANLPRPTFRVLTASAVTLLVLVNYILLWRATPICYQEAFTNSRTRIALETQLATQLRQLPRSSSFLMYLGSHVGALQQAGIPLARSVNEGNHRVWMQPSDSDGLWERSLAHPADHVDYVIAIDGDPVADAMRGQSLPALVHIHVGGQPAATVYKAR
jgi:hypothetical protein